MWNSSISRTCMWLRLVIISNDRWTSTYFSPPASPIWRGRLPLLPFPATPLSFFSCLLYYFNSRHKILHFGENFMKIRQKKKNVIQGFPSVLRSGSPVDSRLSYLRVQQQKSRVHKLNDAWKCVECLTGWEEFVTGIEIKRGQGGEWGVWVQLWLFEKFWHSGP